MTLSHSLPGSRVRGPGVLRALTASVGAALLLVGSALPAVAKKPSPPAPPPAQAPKLTVVVHVVNNNGGTATAGDFTVSIDDAGTNPASFPGKEAPGTTVTIDAGSYNVTVSGPKSYAVTRSAACSGTIATGDNKTCTVTADDAPSGLTVVKHVISDNGGTAVAADSTITIMLNGAAVASFPGSETGTNLKLAAGSYEVIATSMQGYIATYSAGCGGTIAAGQSKVCTIDDDDIQPKILVITQVLNDDGGTSEASDFTLTATGAADFAGSVDGVIVGINAGAYAIGQHPVVGYTTTFDPDCSGNLVVGLYRTCRVRNDDIGTSVLGITVEAGALGITELPRTGLSTADLALGGFALLLLGTALLLLGRARAEQPS